MTPLSDIGPGLLDAMEARTGKLPYKVIAETGSRVYALASAAEAQAFDSALGLIDGGWRDHLSRLG
jgi:hypothetical protein